MDKKRLAADICGVGFVAAGAWFMRQLYEWSGHELLGILFGAVNGSIWEACKTLLLPFLIWSVLELLSIRMPLHRFVAAKTAALYLLGFSYILLRLLSFGDVSAAAMSLCAATVLSLVLFYAPLPQNALFAPSVALLFLFVSLYFSLTPFAPHNPVFLDKATGMYGLIPDDLDYGAIALDAMTKSHIFR